MKTSELSGVALDWAVAKCEPNPENVTHQNGVIRRQPVQYVFSPSIDWAQGGPIIEREGLTVEYLHDSRWIARHPIAKRHSRPIFGEGTTPLIAAMRCYVASKLGDEVEIPEELK